MEDKIKLLLQYIQKEKELTRQWDKEDGIDVDAEDYKIKSLLCIDRIKSFIAYRNIRVEEAWYLKLNRGVTSREVREKACEYDAKRSRRHSLALNSMIGLNMFADKYELPKFYDGEMLEPKEIENYRNIPVRKEQTKFFLCFIDSLSRTSSTTIQKYFEELGIKEKAEEDIPFIRELQSGVESIDSAYGVEETLLDEDGEIKFKDDKKFDRIGR